MNGFTARWIFACWPRFDLVVKRAAHCGHTWGFVSSNEEFLRFLDFGEASRVRGVSSASEELVVLLGLLVRRACGLPTWLNR